MGPGERGHNIDVDYTTSPALFLIGALDRGPLYFDYTTASEVYIEAPQSVFGDDYDPGYVVPSQGGKNGNFYFGNKFGTAPVVQAVNKNASSNVNRLIERINSTEVGNKGWSDFLDKRATNPEYALNDGNNCEYINVVDQKLEIDITDSKFDGKVVYVNLTADMVQYLKESDKFRIRKNPSSIIVFNIEDSVVTDPELTLKKPTMFCDGEKLNGTTATNGHGEIYGWDPDHSANVNAAAVQKLFNETVIWNVMTKKNVRMESMGGTMLFPNSDRVTMETGNCSGWIVAKGTVDAKIQFHFLYNGTTRDSYGQMHFALRKAMTQTYAPKTSVVQDTSVSINKGDFKFYIQEYTDNTYSTTYGTKKAVSVDKNAIATFPTLSFYSDDTGLSDAQKHYYLQIPSGTEKVTIGGKDYYYDKTADILYDATVKEVIVTLTLDNNILSADVQYKDDKVEFTNKKMYTKLSLTKSIDAFIGEDTDGEYVNATLVFRLTYDDPLTGEKGKTREVSVQFDKNNATSQTIEVDKIPIDTTVEVKEIRLSLNIDVHDFDTKVDQAKKFLSAGNKLKVSIRFRGREMAHTDRGTDVMNRFQEAVGDAATVDKPAKLEGRSMQMFMSPKTGK